MMTLPHWLFALLYLHENLLPVAWPSAGQANNTTTPSDVHENTLSPKHYPKLSVTEQDVTGSQYLNIKPINYFIWANTHVNTSADLIRWQNNKLNFDLCRG